MTDYTDLIRRARNNALAHEGPVGEAFTELADALEEHIATHFSLGQIDKAQRRAKENFDIYQHDASGAE